MKVELAYDAAYEPPAPVLSVRISGPSGSDAVLLPMLVDTGADCTLVPPHVVSALSLPSTGVVSVTGLGGAKVRATVHAATLELGAASVLCEVMALADEPILGRDVLNRLVLELDGPALQISVRSPAKRRVTRRRPR